MENAKNDTLDDLARYDLLKLNQVNWLQDYLKKSGETIYFSCNISKINRFGVKQDRVFFVTEKNVYNY